MSLNPVTNHTCHIITELSRSQLNELIEWLNRPNGALSFSAQGKSVTFEAVESGGILVRSFQVTTVVI